MPTVQTSPVLSASDVAKYYLYRASLDGDVITPLKMQKLVYFAYAETLGKKKKRLFTEEIEAWPLGPVVPELYEELKKYGSSPIPIEYLGVKKEEDLTKKFNKATKQTLDKTYEKYIIKSAFELVALIHEDAAWKKAREGLSPDESSNKKIPDSDILKEYSI